ncbi:TFIIB-type zinc ribbon-containing protein [Anaerosporobacter faecicola]|uniref:TFIIB-type zinc ribbon-containing protein n=1 Tax=Anaerosporobacter faecicola TaxID=2718714 RepID=UPI00143A5163|nr:TFIIB-type zinc ribbon-containing protein [Anaerosporobacter faecicola]
MVVQYKCPSCGADMKFDSTTGKLLCESCGFATNIDTMKQNAEGNTTHTDDYSNDTASSFYESDVNQYVCNNCGAVLITEPDTTATTCSFCGAPVVLADRLSGQSAPYYIIPFKINKSQAQEAFKKWCKNGRLTPKGFMTADRIKSMTGLYVPFWLYDLHSNGEMNAACTRVRTYSEGDYIVTETQHYNVYRSADLNYLKIPVDASEKMNDNLMDKLEPFDYSNLKPFNMPYLAGYIAEKYNYNDKDLFPRVQKRVAQYVDTYLRNSIHGYTTVNVFNRNIHIQPKNAFYALLPVWLVCYDYKDSEHIFAMNGETGKIVGKPPLSKGKIAAWFGGITGISFIIIKIIAMLMGGGLF